MSTALVLTLPEHGHINATLPVVEELAARGEQVNYYATAPYRDAIERAGATFLEYGDDTVFRPPAHTGGVYSVMAYVARLAERVLPRLVDDLRREPPDYLLIDSMCLWGHLAVQVRHLPAVTLASVFVPNDRYVTADEMVRLTYGEAPKTVWDPLESTCRHASLSIL